MCTAVNIVYYEKNEDLVFFKFKAFASERSPWQQHDVNSDVHLPNHYTHAKLENFLPITSKNTNHFQNVFFNILDE